MTYSIGLLLPQSSIYASSRDFVWGFRQGIKQASNFPFQLCIENVGYGGGTLLLQQYEKLALQYQPSIILGISHWRPLVEKTALFTNHRIPTLFSEFGANLPLPEVLHENVYFNSLNLWQSTYGTGKYMAQQGYKKVMYLSHFFDGGYHTPYAFCKGLTDNGGNIVAPFSIQDSYTPEELERLEKHLENQQPDALFCVYSNPRHYVLLDWLQSSSFKGLPVFALPYWIDDDLLTNQPNKATTGIHSANSWSRLLKNDTNQRLIHEYEDEEEIHCSAFCVLGFEAGSLIAQAYNALGEKWNKKKPLRSFLLDAKLEGPREGYHFNAEYQCSFSNHHLRQVQQNNAGTLENVIIQDLDVEGSLDSIVPLYEQPNSGWDNPYLCV